KVFRKAGRNVAALLNLRERVNMRSTRSNRTVSRILKHRITCLPMAAAIGLVLCGAGAGWAAEPDGGLDVVQVRPNFYMIAGAGGNIGVQIGVDGVVLMDSGNAAASDQ